MFSLKGIWKNPQSTITGAIGIAAAVGLLPVTGPVIPIIMAGLGILKLFQNNSGGKQ